MFNCMSTRNIRNIKTLFRILNRNCLNPVLSPKCYYASCSTRMPNHNTDSYSNLSSFGRVQLSCDGQFTIRYKLTSVDPQLHPNQDVAFVTADSDFIQSKLSGDVLSVCPSDRASASDAKTGGVDCHVEVPIKFDVDVSLQGHSSICLSNLESPVVNVSVQHGDCHLNNMQTGEFVLRSESGDIVSEKLLQGNGRIDTNDGDINIHKLQAGSVDVSSGGGDITITNLYASHGQLCTRSGHVHLVNSHWDTSVTTGTGDVTVDSVDGDLRVDVDEGDINVTVSQHHNVRLHNNKGDVRISVPMTPHTRLDLQGLEVKVEDGTNHNVTVRTGSSDRSDTQRDPGSTDSRTDTRSGPADAHTGQPEPHIEPVVTEPSITATAVTGKVSVTSSNNGWVAMVQRKLSDK